MVLADDNFATIVNAVSEGRTIYDNIVKFVRFQLSTNVGAILSVLSASLLGLPAPFTAIQILWINIIMDGPPALTLGLDPARPGIMHEAPRSRDQAILGWHRFGRLALYGATMAAGTLALFVAVCVLGAVVLSRRRHGSHAPAPHHDTVQHHDPEPFEAPRRRTGVVAIVGGAAVAAILIVAAGVALLQMRGNGEQRAAEAPPAEFTGQITCTLDRENSEGAQGVSDMSFTASGNLCVNERTLYAPLDDGRYQRVIVLGEARAMDILTINPQNGEFRRERFPLSEDDFAAANQAVAESGVGRGCDGDPNAVAQRNEALMAFSTGTPRQRLLWRCEARN